MLARRPCQAESIIGQNTPDTNWYEWRVMRKKRADEESFQVTFFVKKEGPPFLGELESHLWRSNRELTASMSNSLSVWARGLGKIQEH